MEDFSRGELQTGPVLAPTEGFGEREWTDLAAAVAALERDTLASALNRVVGKHLRSFKWIAPKALAEAASKAVDAALRAALKAAIATLRQEKQPRPATKTLAGLLGTAHASAIAHRAAAALSGAAGGAVGLAALPIELPISTTLMFRSIAEIARAEGEDLSRPEAALACLEVFALSGPTGEEAWDSGYFAVRAALSKALGAGAALAVGRGMLEETAPALVRFTGIVASRFGAAVSQKLAAQAVPILGAAGGAAVNYAFMQHFQIMAKAHFTIRRLERAHGVDVVRDAYERLKLAQAGSRARPVGQTEADPTEKASEPGTA